jgi:hypothetical protein
LNSRVG